MRELHDQISLLIAWMAQKERCPTWAGIHVLDTTRPDVRWIPEIGGWQVTRDALASPSAYEPQFRRLMNAGYGWINLSLYGVHEDSLVVGVELPSEPKKVPPGRKEEGEE